MTHLSTKFGRRRAMAAIARGRAPPGQCKGIWNLSQANSQPTPRALAAVVNRKGALCREGRFLLRS